jgi:hypothetical protein
MADHRPVRVAVRLALFYKTGITPERVGLPRGNTRTSEPFVVRIYKTDNLDQPLKPQPRGYPFTVKKDYKLKANEKPIVHKGVDLSSPASAPPNRSTSGLASTGSSSRQATVPGAQPQRPCRSGL